MTWGQRADLPWLLGLGLYALLEEQSTFHGRKVTLFGHVKFWVLCP